MDLVVNEWLPEYFKPNAGKDDKQSLELFLNKFLLKNDRIFVRNPSPFLTKIYRFSKEFQTNIKVYQHLSLFIKVILQDSNRCKFVDEEIILEDELLVMLNQGNYSSDTYLFEAATQNEDRIIITTDVRLIEQVKDIKGFKVILLSDFLKTY